MRALAPTAVQPQNLTGGSLTADLMHDHGLGHHVFATYQHAAFRLQQERFDTREQAVLSKALNETARIFHEHAENYHAKSIESNLGTPGQGQGQCTMPDIRTY